MQRRKTRKGFFAGISSIGASIVRIGTTSRHQKAFVVGLAGLGLILVAHIPRLWAHLPEYWPIISLEIGIACIIAAIAEFILLEHAVAAIREEIQHETKLIFHCSRHHLIDVISPRTQENSPALKQISKAIKDAEGDVCILGLSLQDFLTDRHAPNNGLLGLLNEPIRANKINVKMLLIDPASNAADVWGYAEQGASSLEDNELRSRVINSIFRIKRMKATAKDLRIEARFHNAIPSFYMISTSNTLFIEPYHFGSRPGRVPHVYGTAPILRFSPQSEMYQLAQSHFSYIWNSQEHANESTHGGRRDGKFLSVKTFEQVIKEADRRKVRRERRANHPDNVPRGDEKRSGADRRASEPVAVAEDEQALGQRASKG